MNIIEKIFKLKELNTNISTEIAAGITTFFTMSYLFILGPKLLESAGLNFGASITITSLVIFICCIFMALYANKPYATAPFLGETAFVAYTIVPILGFDIKTVLAAYVITGILLFIMTISNIRLYIINRIPDTIKISFCCGLGLYFIYIALKNIGFIDLLVHNADNLPTKTDILHCILGLFCFILLTILIKKGLKSAIIIAIISTTVIGIILSDIQLPTKLISLPINPISSMFLPDFSGLLDFKFISAFILIFLLANIDTAGSLIGLTYKDKTDTNDLKKPLIIDSISTIIAPFFGTTTTGAYIDSMTGISVGGKTGLTSLTVGFLFLIGLIFTPIIMIIPSYAYAPVLLYVGILLCSNFSKINFEDITEYAVAILTISLMIFTQNIGFGIIAGFVLYPLIKLISGEAKKTNIIHWVMFVIGIIFFIIYPY